MFGHEKFKEKDIGNCQDNEFILYVGNFVPIYFGKNEFSRTHVKIIIK